MIEYKCPVCSEKLSENEKSFSCPNGHLFDRARSGYVNLLQNSSSRGHGDDKMMIAARKAFLEKGYYKPLLEYLSEITQEYIPNGSDILDAGCGEGYYSEAIKNKAANCDFCGIDISKNAVEKTAKRLKDGKFAVASVYELPFFGEKFDAVYSIFSPLAEEEFLRIIKKGGYLIRVYPLENHLFELKKAVYENPYKNEEIKREIMGFEEISVKRLEYMIKFESNEDIKNLFFMTPYSHKTSETDIKKLDLLKNLECNAAFGISIYQKSKNTCQIP